MADKSDKAVKALAQLLTYAVGVVPLALLRGVVVRDMWAWFVVPLGVKPIGMAEAIGLSLLVSYVTYTYVDNEEDWPVVAGFIRSLIITLICWGWAAIYAHFR